MSQSAVELTDVVRPLSSRDDCEGFLFHRVSVVVFSCCTTFSSWGPAADWRSFQTV